MTYIHTTGADHPVKFMKLRKVYISSMLQDFCTGDGMLAPSIFTVLNDPRLGDTISAAEATVETSSDLHTFWYALCDWLNSGTDTSQLMSVDTLVTFMSQMQDQMGLSDEQVPEPAEGTGTVGGGQQATDPQATHSQSAGGQPDDTQRLFQTADGSQTDGSQSVVQTADGSQSADGSQLANVSKDEKKVPATKKMSFALAAFPTRWAARFKGDQQGKVWPSGILQAIILEIEKAMLHYADTHDVTINSALTVANDAKISVTQKVQKKTKPLSLLLRGKCTLVPTPRSYLVCSAGSVDIYVDGEADDTTTHPCLAWLIPSAADESDYNMEITGVEHEISFQRGPIKQTFTLKMKSIRGTWSEDGDGKGEDADTRITSVTYVRPSLESEMAKEKKRKVSSIGSAINEMLGVKPPGDTPAQKKQRRSSKTASGEPVSPLVEFGEFTFLALPLHGDLVDGNEPQIPYK